MKKSLVALAVLAAAGAASAQSSVTLWGIVDANLAHGSGSVANKTQLANSGYNSSRLGFRGVEDLGGGLKGGFWLEAGVNNDNGSFGTSSTNNQATGATGGGGMTFNRRSTVSVGGGFGEVRLGRDYTPHFWTQTVYDPFGTNGVGTTQTLNSSTAGTTTVRASNSIAYLYNPGSFNGNSLIGSGLGLFVQHYMGENASNAAGNTKNDGSGTSGRISYDQGPLSVALAMGQTKFATGNITTTNIGGSYNLGAVKLAALYNQDKVQNGANQTGYMLGANAPMGAGELRGSLSTSKTNAAGSAKSNKFALGYVHNLSKRTAVYTTYARVTNSGGASQALNGATTAANSNSSGFDLGLRHSF